MSKIVLGLDPGAHGGIAVTQGYTIHTYKMPQTYPDIFSHLSGIVKSVDPEGIVAVLEKVGQGLPGQSSKATATFARHCGHLEMALYALGIPTVEVTPKKWQKHYSNELGSSKGLSRTEWKNKLKGVAQRLYPSESITLDTADAVLLAHYGKSLGL